uniref:Uncharacterized protein n=1 Tax=Anguilla anguilla TaxID=7936 RepID=A0A0E9X7W3_ANGAN
MIRYGILWLRCAQVTLLHSLHSFTLNWSHCKAANIHYLTGEIGTVQSDRVLNAKTSQSV